MPKNISQENADQLTAELKKGREEAGSAAEGTQTGQVENSAAGAKAGAGAGEAADKAKEQKPTRTVEEIEKEFNDYKSGEPTRFEAEKEKFLRAFAQESPANWEYVYGPDQPPPAGLFDEDGKAKPAAKEPGKEGEEDPRDKRIAALEAKERAREQDRVVMALSDTVETEMSRYDEVFNPQKNPLGPQLVKAVTSELLKSKSPHQDAKKIVDAVASNFIEFEKKREEKYLGGKTKAAESIPAGAGKGAGPQAGGAPTEYDFSKRHGAGSMRDGLATALREARGK